MKISYFEKFSHFLLLSLCVDLNFANPFNRCCFVDVQVWLMSLPHVLLGITAISELPDPIPQMASLVTYVRLADTAVSEVEYYA